jgi:hypothetical protein
MRQALAAGDSADAQKAMRAAATALQDAAKHVGK